jgi:hypothetical protein
MTRLCRPLSRLFQYVDKSDDCPACRRAEEPTAAIRRERQIGGRTGLTFPELWNDCAVHAPTGSRTPLGMTEND